MEKKVSVNLKKKKKYNYLYFLETKKELSNTFIPRKSNS